MIAVTGAEMARLDRRAIDELAIPSLALMERAGEAVYRAIRARFPVRGQRVAVLAGAGNNGGDGFVVARLLHRAGARVTVVLAADPDHTTADAAHNWRRVAALPAIHADRGGAPVAAAQAAIAGAALIVDALLGTGFSPPLRPPYDMLVVAVNRATAPVVAVDLPSGLASHRHDQSEGAVEAAVTVTFAFPKICLCQYPSRRFGGEIAVANIGIPESLAEPLATAPRLLDAQAITPALAPPPADQHKGSAGRVVVVAGHPGMAGAAALAVKAAYRAGAGYVTLAAPEQVVATVQGWVPEVVGRPDVAPGDPLFDAAVGQAGVLLVGPGLPAERASAWLAHLLPLARCPVVVDAGGLAALAAEPALWARRSAAPLLITPHPGEFAPLVAATVAAVQADRLTAARELATARGCFVCLKGAYSVVADPDGALAINLTGQPGMATAGAGDVLAGLVSGLLAQRHAPGLALRAAVYLHGRAGEVWARDRDGRGLLASDLIAALPVAMAEAARPAPLRHTLLRWLAR